jgi:hypothetical protein
VAALAAIGGALVLAVVAALFLLRAPPALPPSPEPVAQPALPLTVDAGIPESGAVIATVSGTVERFKEGAWSSVQAGERLHTADSIRAGSRSKADLDLGPKARLTLSEESQLTVAELSGKVHRVRLQRGRVSAAYEPEGERVLRIEGHDGEAVAETRGARFSAMATETGFVVATETGKVNLQSSQGTVEVTPGQQAMVQPGHAPSAAAPIPIDLLLKVATASRPTGKCEVIEGTASPGAEVLVDGVPATVSPDGRFRQTLGPPPKQRVLVVTRDASGRTVERTVSCRAAPSPAPPAGEKIDGVEIRWNE